MRLKDCYNSRLVRLDLEADDPDSVLVQAASWIAAERPELQADELLKRFRKREEMGSTALGEGIALPHARVPGLEGAFIAIARLTKPVEWGAPDKQPVWLAVFSIVDEQKTQLHLQMLARLSRILHIASQREAVRDAASPEAVVEIFTHAVH
jgi:PTS system nitrogen regulatory IIA component